MTDKFLFSDRKKKVCCSQSGSNQEDQQVLTYLLGLRYIDYGPEWLFEILFLTQPISGWPLRTCLRNLDQASCHPATVTIKGYNTSYPAGNANQSQNSKFSIFLCRVASVSNKLLMGNRDVRQIYDKQWTVTVVDQVLIGYSA